MIGFYPLMPRCPAASSRGGTTSTPSNVRTGKLATLLYVASEKVEGERWRLIFSMLEFRMRKERHGKHLGVETG